MDWLHSYKLRLQRKIRMHLTEPNEFLWFGCTDAKKRHNEKQNASHKTLTIPMVRLHSHQLRLQQKTGCIWPNPMNSLGLAVFTPNNAKTKNRVHLTKPYEFLRFGCIHAKQQQQQQTWLISASLRRSCVLIAFTPIKTTAKKQDAPHRARIVDIGCLHSHQS